MKVEVLQDWLEAYGRAWETRDPSTAQELFTEEATYQETPFEKPMRGRAGIYEYWAEATRTQAQVKFDSEVLAVTGGRGIARWRASFIRVSSGVQVQLDGILIVSLNEEGRCTEFQEWWHRRDQPLPPNTASGSG